jgi:hypothetical protein
MGEYELAMMPGLGPITATKIKAAFYRYRWEINNGKKIKTFQQLRALIDTLDRKEEILHFGIEKLFLPVYNIFAFIEPPVQTVGDLLRLSDEEILEIKGIGRIRYNQILNCLLEIAIIFDEELGELIDVPKLRQSDPASYSQPQLSFRDVLAMALDEFSPRNREILFEYYLVCGATRGSYQKVASRYNLTHERIRQICMKGVRHLRHRLRIDCITTYLSTVWREKIYRFATAAGGVVTKTQLEQEFANDLPEVYFLQNEILKIDDIWKLHLKKSNDLYYLSDSFASNE